MMSDINLTKLGLVNNRTTLGDVAEKNTVFCYTGDDIPKGFSRTTPFLVEVTNPKYSAKKYYYGTDDGDSLILHEMDTGGGRSGGGYSKSSVSSDWGYPYIGLSLYESPTSKVLTTDHVAVNLQVIDLPMDTVILEYPKNLYLVSRVHQLGSKYVLQLSNKYNINWNISIFVIDMDKGSCNKVESQIDVYRDGGTTCYDIIEEGNKLSVVIPTSFRNPEGNGIASVGGIHIPMPAVNDCNIDFITQLASFLPSGMVVLSKNNSEVRGRNEEYTIVHLEN
jgi:hypothetical protein